MKVLIVDDSPLTRKQLKKFFENELNYEVVGLGKDGYEGVALAQTHEPDLITLDITMPNKDGLQALAEIMEFNSEIRVIMVSALSEADSIARALKMGAKTYIEKPLEFKSPEFVENFKDSIEEALE